MRIAIDIDSTLHHYWDLLSDAARRRFGVELPYEAQLTWGITRLRPDQLAVCVADTHSEHQILTAEPYPGAVEAIGRWHASGHAVLVMSHRTPAAQQTTDRWLRRIGLPFDELHCTDDKIARCREAEVALLIDDSPINLQRALDAGIEVATILHPWNRDLCEEEAILCAPDWPSLAARLEARLAREAGQPAPAGELRSDGRDAPARS